MIASFAPCKGTRTRSSLTFASRLEAEITTIDQPTPRITSAIGVSARLASSYVAATKPIAVDSTSTPIPATLTGTAPNRSVAQPKIGESAYIPMMWRETTNPTNDNVIPSCTMYSGVITITMTMTACAEPVATTPNLASGSVPDQRSAARAPRGSAVTADCGARVRAVG